MASSRAFRSAPLAPLVWTITWMFSGDIRSTTVLTASGELNVGGWPWTSTTGNFARGTLCSGTTSVDRGL